MRQRTVVISPEAKDDLLALYDRIAEAANADIAMAYIDRLEDYCMAFDLASERGTRREDVRPGLRITNFEKRVTVAFSGRGSGRDHPSAFF